MEEFCLINKNRDRIKIFKPFEDITKPSPTINAMEIAYLQIYKREIVKTLLTIQQGT